LAPTYEKVAQIYERDDCVVANVDATQQEALAERYDVKGYPTIKFFSKDGVIEYEGGRSLGDFVSFLNEKCGLDRKEDGTLGPKAGRIEALDAMVQDLVASSQRAPLLKELKAEAATFDLTFAKYYVKVAEKFVKNTGYPAKERKRLQSIIEGGQTNPQKRDEFQIRANILSVFMDAGEHDEL
jgi:thiol-disulfide isomerase/thioredoxin